MGSIKGKVAIIGAGCCKFGENFEKNYDDMVIEAVYEALEDAGLETGQIDGFCAVTQATGQMGGIIIAYLL